MVKDGIPTKVPGRSTTMGYFANTCGYFGHTDDGIKEEPRATKRTARASCTMTKSPGEANDE